MLKKEAHLGLRVYIGDLTLDFKHGLLTWVTSVTLVVLPIHLPS